MIIIRVTDTVVSKMFKLIYVSQGQSSFHFWAQMNIFEYFAVINATLGGFLDPIWSEIMYLVFAHSTVADAILLPGVFLCSTYIQLLPSKRKVKNAKKMKNFKKGSNPLIQNFLRRNKFYIQYYNYKTLTFCALCYYVVHITILKIP